MTKVKELIDHLNQQFPPRHQESYDNSGFLVGDPNDDISGVLITLDVTSEVIEEALSKHLNVIISHHPLIFSGVKRITPSDQTGRLLRLIIQNHLNIYAAHTNLDNLPNGVNGILALKLGLVQSRILRPSNPDNPNIGAGMIATLPSPTTLPQFVSHIKTTLQLPQLRASNPKILAHHPIHKVAICGGSGAFLIDDAKRAGAQIFLTGDLKYHDFQHAQDDLLLLDIGHYESEQFAKEIFYFSISEKFRNFACQISEQSRSFIYYI